MSSLYAQHTLSFHIHNIVDIETLNSKSWRTHKNYLEIAWHVICYVQRNRKTFFFYLPMPMFIHTHNMYNATNRIKNWIKNKVSWLFRKPFPIVAFAVKLKCQAEYTNTGTESFVSWMNCWLARDNLFAFRLSLTLFFRLLATTSMNFYFKQNRRDFPKEKNYFPLFASKCRHL